MTILFEASLSMKIYFNAYKMKLAACSILSYYAAISTLESTVSSLAKVQRW